MRRLCISRWVWRVIDDIRSANRSAITALRLALFFLKKSSSTSPDSSKSIVLVGSTSSYFGGTGVTAYVASKHGVLGLLRACQPAAKQNGVRVNVIAPFLTPTQITVGFSQKWRDEGLEENTPQGVAEAIATVSLDESRTGHSLMVSMDIHGRSRHEICHES